MKQGFIKVAAATPDIRVADVPFNTKQICSAIEEAQNNQAKIVVFPELCVTGYTCGDLFTQDVLLQAAKQALLEITEFTREKDMLVFVGVPLVVDAKLYNVAAMVSSMRCVSLRQGRMCREKSCLTAKKCRLVRGFCFRHPLWKS